jgi:hypothetical protein
MKAKVVAVWAAPLLGVAAGVFAQGMPFPPIT